jgi:hypothetical protein
MTAECGCKGARSCVSCRDSDRVKNLRIQPDTEDFSHYKCYVFANGVAVHCPQLNFRSTIDEVATASRQTHEPMTDLFNLSGISLIEDFLTEQEEADIVSRIDNNEWMLSQSGRRKQVCEQLLKLGSSHLFLGFRTKGELQAQKGKYSSQLFICV